MEDEVHDLLMGHQHRSHPPLSSSSTGSTFQQHLSPAPHSGGTSSSSTRVHPSVAAQRASAGRVYKRKASTCSLNGNNPAQGFSPHERTPSVGYTPNLGILNYHHQLPQSPTPQGSFSNHQHQLSDHLTTTSTTNTTTNNHNTVGNLPSSLPPAPRKTRRSNAWKSGGDNGQ